MGKRGLGDLWFSDTLDKNHDWRFVTGLPLEYERKFTGPTEPRRVWLKAEARKKFLEKAEKQLEDPEGHATFLTSEDKEDCRKQLKALTSQPGTRTWKYIRRPLPDGGEEGLPSKPERANNHHNIFRYGQV